MARWRSSATRSTCARKRTGASATRCRNVGARETADAGSFKFAGYLRVRNVEHFKVDANGVRRQHELLVQEVKKPNLPTSQ